MYFCLFLGVKGYRRHDQNESISGSQELGLGDQVNKFAVSVFVTLLFFVSKPALAQMDVAFGASTLNSASSTTPTFIFGPQPLNGGTYLSISGNQLFFKEQFGVGGEISWKASQALYAGYQPYRPIFWDFNGVWVPKMGKRASGEFQAGIGRRVFVSTTIFTRATSLVHELHDQHAFHGTLQRRIAALFAETPLSVLRFTLCREQ